MLLMGLKLEKFVVVIVVVINIIITDTKQLGREHLRMELMAK